MLYAIGVIVFAVGLLASIALHEVGHMLPAKRFGVKVTQYMVGFGPTLWSRKRGDTEYGFKAIPAGGYIRMIGMVPPRQDGRRSRWPTRIATTVEEFRAASRSEVIDPADEPRQFYRLTPGKKMIVMLGGPCMNFVIYAVITVLLFTVIGQFQSDPTTTVGSVVQCVVPANSTDATKGVCPAGAPTAPAVGKLQPGDVIESIDGTKVASWTAAVKVIQASAGKSLSITILRAGTQQTIAITPVRNENYVNDSSSTVKEVGYLGVGPTTHDFYQRDSLVQIPGQIVSQFAQGLHAIASYPSKITSLWGTVFDGKARDPNGAIGVVGLGEIGGQIASTHQIGIRDKVFFLLSLLASVNLLLFFFNLLPLLPLDGGHVAGALLEAARRGRARLRHRRRRRLVMPDGSVALGAGGGDRAGPEPIYVDTAQMLPIMYAVASVLLLLTLLVVYADIVKPVHLS